MPELQERQRLLKPPEVARSGFWVNLNGDEGIGLCGPHVLIR